MITWTWKTGLAALSVMGALVFTYKRASAAKKSRLYGYSDPRDVLLTPWWTDQDIQYLDDMSYRILAYPPDMLLTLAGESGLKPFAKAPTGAVGLNQLTSAANSTAGITEAQRLAIPGLSVTEQLPIVDRFFSNLAWTKAGKSYPNVCVLWEANFSPGFMTSRGTSPDTKLYALSDKDGGKAYDANSKLDIEGKGWITVGDLCRRLGSVSKSEVYLAALSRLRDVTGKDYSPRFP